ncbi:MAG: ABC transporter ATP-binding protein [Lachnospiraceae bacterium]
MSLLEVRNVKRVYTTRLGAVKVQALSDVNFSVEEGEYVAIMGESGSGKTTLLNILASLDKATSGQVLLNGKDLSQIRHREICAFRREHLGFVFQDFNLLDTLSLKDNIYLPLVLAGAGHREMEKRLQPLAQKLSVADILDKYPYEVSGGQRQRAAVCRALITKPDIILADEPTGALDSKAANKLLGLFGEVNREGQTILMVTHSIQAASHAGRVLFIKDGCVFHQIYKGSQSNEAMYKMISDALTVLQTETGADKIIKRKAV